MEATAERIARLTEYIERMVGIAVEVKPGIWLKVERVTDPDSGATKYRLARIPTPVSDRR
jgi:hypothetical protein